MALTFSGSLFTIGARAKATAPQSAGRVLVAGARRIVDAARGPWPVKTGVSRASLGWVWDGHEIRIEAVYYSPYIFSRGVHPWDAYIAGPLRQFILYEAPRQIGHAAIGALVEGARG